MSESESADRGKSPLSITDVEQLPLLAAIGSLGYVFWIVGGMEMVERVAYYGVKAVATLYAKDPVSKGGLGVTMNEFGNLLFVWAFLQTFVPVLTGGLSDRYGYKETIFASTVVKIAGYVVMAFFPTYWGFFAGAMLLAVGTAIFKPGIQGTLVRSTTRQNSSVAWAIFYQTVNIGGYIGPLIAGMLRKMEWRYVFFACALIICCNFLLLLTYKEVGREERLARAASGQQEGLLRLFRTQVREFFRPQVFLYVMVFSGFWFMFNSLFDVLPAHIDDWVDTRSIVSTVLGSGGSTNPLVNFFFITNEAGTEIQPEGLLNVNAGLIMLTCFLFGAISAKMRAITSMVVGTLLASAALLLSGYSTLGWISLGAIAIFSVGEMLSSPKFLEYIGNFAPSDKKAMYLGFSQFSLGIGWTLEGKLGGMLYEKWASKEAFSRQALAERGWGTTEIAALPQGEAFGKLVEVMGTDEWTVTHTLYAQHADSIGRLWYLMGGIGVVTAVGIYAYGVWANRLQRAR